MVRWSCEWGRIYEHLCMPIGTPDDIPTEPHVLFSRRENGVTFATNEMFAGYLTIKRLLDTGRQPGLTEGNEKKT
jgi:hypothetical protein